MRRKSESENFDETVIPFSVMSGEVTFSPEIEFIDHALRKPVVSCQEAAREKGIPLKNELKTLILKTCLEYIALQTPGNKKVSLRKVKNILNVNRLVLHHQMNCSYWDWKREGFAPFRPPLGQCFTW
jgi:hypothetical protein